MPRRVFPPHSAEFHWPVPLCSPQLDTAHAVTVEKFVQLFQMQLFHKTVRVIFCEIVCGMLVRLHDFFFQRHALQQVFYPLFDVLLGS